MLEDTQTDVLTGSLRGRAQASPNHCLAVRWTLNRDRMRLKAIGSRASLGVCNTFHGAGQLCAPSLRNHSGTAAGAPAHTGSVLRVLAPTRARSCLGPSAPIPHTAHPKHPGWVTLTLAHENSRSRGFSGVAARNPVQEAWTGTGVGVRVGAAAHRALLGDQADTHLLRPASTTNCPWGLQKMVLACCLSNISERKGGAVRGRGAGARAHVQPGLRG